MLKLFYWRLRLFGCIDLGTRPGYPHGSFSRNASYMEMGELNLLKGEAMRAGDVIFIGD